MMRQPRVLATAGVPLPAKSGGNFTAIAPGHRRQSMGLPSTRTFDKAHPKFAYAVFLSGTNPNIGTCNRYEALPVRPVYTK